MRNYNYKIQGSIGGRKEQQDFSGACDTGYGLLVVVCDGMGGAKGGATASRMAVEIILSEFNKSKHSLPAAALNSAIKKANAEIFQRSATDSNCRGMGTTVTAVVLQDEKVTVAHVGDSRVYQLRKSQPWGHDWHIVYKTFDHSKVFELVRRGIMNEEEARVSDDSNVILRALGIKPDVEVEIKDNLPYLKGDYFMLCTDGVCGALPEKRMLNLFGDGDRRETASILDNLIVKIDQKGLNAGGGHDNLTAALIKCERNSKLKTPVTMQSKITIAALSLLLVLAAAFISVPKYGLLAKVNMLNAKTDSLGRQLKIQNDSNRNLKLEVLRQEELIRQKRVDGTVAGGMRSKSGVPITSPIQAILPAGEQPLLNQKPAVSQEPKKKTPTTSQGSAGSGNGNSSPAKQTPAPPNVITTPEEKNKDNPVPVNIDHITPAPTNPVTTPPKV